MADSARQWQTGELSNTGAFSILPNELLLAICSALSDADLLALCRTSRYFNDLALHVFFSRHGHFRDAAISVNSASTLGIPVALSFFDRFESLSCTFNDATAKLDVLKLTHLVSRLPRIKEVEVNLVRSDPQFPLIELFLGLLFALAPDKSSTLVILHHNKILISRRRRVYSRLEDFAPTIKIDNAYIFVAAVLLFLLSQKFLDLWTILSDPLKRKRQNDRIREDVHINSSIASLRVIHRFLPDPGFSKWILVGIDQSYMTCLQIHSNPLLPTILPAITLPALTNLTICNKALLPFKSFVGFLMRHPSLTDLTLEDYSVTYTDLTSLPPNTLLHLQSLSAPLRHILNILRDSSAAGAGEWPNMMVVGFPPPTMLTLSKFGQYRIDPRAGSEPFDFSVFDQALRLVATRLSHHDISLHLQIPADSTSRVWFDSATQGHGRPETNMHHVSSVKLRTHQNRPLDHHLLSLLPKWLELFPKLKHVTLCEYLAPTQDARDELLQKVHEALPNVSVLFCLG
jgi:hypothetical protein